MKLLSTKNTACLRSMEARGQGFAQSQAPSLSSSSSSLLLSLFLSLFLALSSLPS